MSENVFISGNIKIRVGGMMMNAEHGDFLRNIVEKTNRQDAQGPGNPVMQFWILSKTFACGLSVWNNS